MATRISYQIGNPAAVTMYSLNSHPIPIQDPESNFRFFAENVRGGAKELLDNMLNANYRSAGGEHKARDPKFMLDLEPHLSEYTLVVDPVTREVTKIDRKAPTGAVGAVIAEVKSLIEAVNELDDDLNRREQCPTGDTYNDLFGIVNNRLNGVLGKLHQVG